MKQSQMEAIIKLMAERAKGQPGYLQFDFHGVSMHLISDAYHNRMRIIAPITAYDQLQEEQKEAMLIANFHSSLDTRYAVSDGIVYAAYVHPLAELTDEQVKSAMRQIASAVLSFGSEYTSGELQFNGL